MHQYITDTEYAVRGLVELITAEERRLDQLQGQYRGLSNKVEYLNKSLLDAPFNDDMAAFQEQAMAVDRHMTNEELSNLRKHISAAQDSIDAKSVSIDALCGAILQIAKQGISTVHGGLSGCPDGRSIGTGTGAASLKNVIWAARNQSMHYEENLNQHAIDCFAKLKDSCSDKFSLALNPGKNLAHDVIQELGWKDYLRYELDMRSLI